MEALRKRERKGRWAVVDLILSLCLFVAGFVFAVLGDWGPAAFCLLLSDRIERIAYRNAKAAGLEP